MAGVPASIDPAQEDPAHALHQGRDAPWRSDTAPTPLVRLLSARWSASARMRTSPGARLDVRYGPRLHNRLDYYPARRRGPVVVLMAGSYDEPCSKDELAFVALGALAHGLHLAIVDTSRAPGQTPAGMLGEYRAALRWLAARADRFGGDTRRMVVCGWGAGALAAALCLEEAGVLGGLAVSGIYDLARMTPDAACAWRLAPADAALLDPCRRSPGARPLVLATGDEDPGWMQAQSRCIASWREGLPGALLRVPQQDAHSLLAGLADPGGVLVAHLCALAIAGAGPLHAGPA